MDRFVLQKELGDRPYLGEEVVKQRKSWNTIYRDRLQSILPEELTDTWWIEVYNQIQEYLKTVFRDFTGKRILECGCGTGNSSLRLERHGAEVYLSDIARNAIACSTRVAAYYCCINTHCVLAENCFLPFNNETFDLTWNVGVIEHYPFKALLRMALEMMRVTKENGRIILGIPNPLCMQMMFYRGISSHADEKFYSSRTLKKIFNLLSAFHRVSGLRIDHVGPVLPMYLYNQKFEKHIASTPFSRLMRFLIFCSFIKR